MIEGLNNIKFATLTNAELIKILQSETDFTNEQIEVAKAELNSRNLSDEEMQTVKERFFYQFPLKSNRKLTKSGIVNEIDTYIKAFHLLVKPGKWSVRKQVNVVCFLFVIDFFKNIYRDRLYFFSNSFLNHPDIIYLLPYIAILAMAYLLWKRKAIGWYLATISFTTAGFALITGLGYDLYYIILDKNYLIERLYSPNLIYMIALEAATLHFLYKKSIRKYFHISNSGLLGVWIILAVLVFLLFNLWHP